MGCLLSSSAACALDFGSSSSKDQNGCGSMYDPSDASWSSSGASYTDSGSYDGGPRPPSSTCTLGETRCREGASYHERCADLGGGYRSWVMTMPCNPSSSARSSAVCRSGVCAAPPEPCRSLRVQGPAVVEVGAHYSGPSTYEAWAKLEPEGSADGGAEASDPDGGDRGSGLAEAIVFGQGGGDGGVAGWVASCVPGKLVVDVFAPSGRETLAAETTCADGAFHHVAVTFDTGTNVFFDGVLVGQTSALPAVRSLPLYVGSYGARPVTGTTTLDDVIVTGRVRYTTDFAADAATPPTMSWFGLFFDEGKGTRAHLTGLGSATYATVDDTMWVDTCR